MNHSSNSLVDFVRGIAATAAQIEDDALIESHMALHPSLLAQLHRCHHYRADQVMSLDTTDDRVPFAA